MLSSAAVAELTGRRELAKARQIGGQGDEAGSTDCGYVGSSLQVEIQPLESIERFTTAAEKLVKSGEFQPVQGVGDAAWFRINRIASQYGFVVRVGRNVASISIDMSEGGAIDRARSTLLALGKAAAGKLPK